MKLQTSSVWLFVLIFFCLSPLASAATSEIFFEYRCSVAGTETNRYLPSWSMVRVGRLDQQSALRIDGWEARRDRSRLPASTKAGFYVVVQKAVFVLNRPVAAVAVSETLMMGLATGPIYLFADPTGRPIAQLQCRLQP